MLTRKAKTSLTFLCSTAVTSKDLRSFQVFVSVVVCFINCIFSPYLREKNFAISPAVEFFFSISSVIPPASGYIASLSQSWLLCEARLLLRWLENFPVSCHVCPQMMMSYYWRLQEIIIVRTHIITEHIPLSSVEMADTLFLGCDNDVVPTSIGLPK